MRRIHMDLGVAQSPGAFISPAVWWAKLASKTTGETADSGTPHLDYPL